MTRTAGILAKKYYNKRTQQVNYNKEIPFEKKPTPGFYNTFEDMLQSEEPA